MKDLQQQRDAVEDECHELLRQALRAEIERRARAEQQLLHAEERFKLLLDSTAEGIYAVSPDGLCTFCNCACLRLLGYADPRDLLGRHIHSVIHHTRADGTACTGQDCQLHQGSQRDEAVHVDTDVFWRGDGTPVPVEFWAHPIRRADQLLGSIVTFVDITERQRSERTLQKLSRAIEQTADAVMITNRAGVIEYVNPAYEALSGFSAREALGRTPEIVKSGVQDAAFYEKLWTTILSGGVFSFVVTNKSKEGRLYNEDQTITPIRDSAGEITHFVSTGRDITARKHAEDALRLLNKQLELETERIAGVLHDEAGQFLASAHITLADIARDVPAPLQARLQAVRRHLDGIEAQLRRVSHELHPRILEELGLLEAIRFYASAFARRTGIAVAVEAQLESSCPLPIQLAVYRIVQEALTNIGKHARATMATVAIACNGSHLSCSIRDDGAGFDVAPTLAREGDHGLGLQLIQGRLEAIGGSLEIISAPGRGTELRTTIPADR